MSNKEFFTISMVKSLLEIQANSFNASLKLLFDELKDELKCVKKDISDLQQSLGFSQGQLDTSMKRIEQVEEQLNVNNKFLKDTSDSLDAMNTELEYLENQSRRNNTRIMGVWKILIARKAGMTLRTLLSS